MNYEYASASEDFILQNLHETSPWTLLRELPFPESSMNPIPEFLDQPLPCPFCANWRYATEYTGKQTVWCRGV